MLLFFVFCKTVPTGYPTDVTLMALSASTVSATWDDVPCDTLGSKDVLRYEYELESDNGIITGSVTSKTETFSNLQCKTVYSFRVKTITNDGEGPFSEYVTAETLITEGKYQGCLKKYGIHGIAN